MSKFAPGMRVIIRDEEWMIKKCDVNSNGYMTIQCMGISPVSYTHIPKGCTKERVLNSLIPSVGDRPFPYPLPLMHIGLKYFDWLDAVSYTHLDVYKRQP